MVPASVRLPNGVSQLTSKQRRAPSAARRTDGAGPNRASMEVIVEP
jgi:hypothetical protein